MTLVTLKHFVGGLRSSTAIAALAGASVAAGPMSAQSYYAALRGTVVDQNGGAVVAAKVTLGQVARRRLDQQFLVHIPDAPNV